MRVTRLILAAAAAVLLAAPAQAELAKCTMTFDLSGWSLAYKQMKGKGTVTCSNGQSASVAIESHGAGFTIGKSDIVNGKGTFSEVKDISEIFGTYAKLEARGSANKGGAAQVMTKGEISLALSGEGRGWEAGVSLSGLTIKRK
jgi:hypothetical protein